MTQSSRVNAYNIRQRAAAEAVIHLGYLRVEGAETIINLMTDGMTQHPRATATAYRKAGEQLSVEDKKGLGIRANGFLSQTAFEELTELGKAFPLIAHEKTLLRAVYTENRFRLLNAPIPADMMEAFAGWRYETATRHCAFCRRVDGKYVHFDDVAILPAPDCECEAPAYIVKPRFDWFKGRID